MCEPNCDCFSCRLNRVIDSDSNISLDVDEEYSGGDVDFDYYQNLYKDEDLGSDSTSNQTKVCGAFRSL